MEIMKVEESNREIVWNFHCRLWRLWRFASTEKQGFQNRKFVRSVKKAFFFRQNVWKNTISICSRKWSFPKQKIKKISTKMAIFLVAECVQKYLGTLKTVTTNSRKNFLRCVSVPHFAIDPRKWSKLYDWLTFGFEKSEFWWIWTKFGQLSFGPC